MKFRRRIHNIYVRKREDVFTQYPSVILRKYFEFYELYNLWSWENFVKYIKKKHILSLAVSFPFYVIYLYLLTTCISIYLPIHLSIIFLPFILNGMEIYILLNLFYPRYNSFDGRSTYRNIFPHKTMKKQSCTCASNGIWTSESAVRAMQHFMATVFGL
jgi:hypothetical protein